MGFKEALIRKAAPAVFSLRKHSPKILFSAGVVGFAATVVLATRATMKLEKLVEDVEKTKAEIEAAVVGKQSTIYSEDDAKKDLAILYSRFFIKLIKLYGPAIVVGAASVAALTGSHVILSNRVTNLTAAYAVLDKGFREYRRRVVEKLGKEQDEEFRFGTEEYDEVEETSEGPLIVTKQGPLNGRSIYARVFDEGSTQWSREPNKNQFFLRATQDYANDLLRSKGIVFLNDIYDMLGLARSPEGQVVGWVNGSKNGDGYIDFGIFENADKFTSIRFIRGDERNVILDFNVDGVVYDQLGK